MLDAPELTVDLGAITANWRLLASRAATADCGAVLKANGYGTGAPEVSARLLAEGCKSFFVALESEAIALRPTIGDADLYVLGGLPPDGAGRFAAAGIRPVLSSLPELEEWFCWTDANGPAPAALHVDTGMNRLGLDLAEALQLSENRLLDAGIDLVISHFVSAEVPGDPMTAQQQAHFRQVCEKLPNLRASLSNSSGLFLESRVPENLARPGFALYGGNPTPGRPNPMQAAVRLVAPILQLRRVPAGIGVGYNGAWHAPGDRLIATIGIGYADGFLRAGSSADDHPGASVIVREKLCPLAGRVSMDLVTIDVSDVPGVQRGDPVELIGPGLPVDAAGRMLGTSGYEVLTGLSRRARRVYLG